MSDPVTFPTATSRFGLPLLFSGQSQKEFYFNEAISLADILMQPTVQGESNIPPVTPVDGDCWIVGTQPSGAWDGRAGSLAGFQSGQWLFITPRDGMRAFDLNLQAERFFNQGWSVPTPVVAPSGGNVIDTQARNAIAGLIASLVSAGILND